MGIASFVLSAVSLFFLVIVPNVLTYFLAFICSTLALIFGAVDIWRNPKGKTRGVLEVILNSMLLFGILFMVIDSFSQKKLTTIVPKTVSKQTISEVSRKPLYKFSDKEEVFLRALITDDFRSAAMGRKGVFSEEGYEELSFVTTASLYQSDYEKNEAAADMKYLNKYGAISGVVDSVNKGVDQQYFVSLKGENRTSLTPIVRMKNGYLNFIAGLEKKQKITLVCRGAGMTLQFASVSECLPVDDWASIAAHSRLQTIKLGTAPKSYYKIVAFGVALFSLLPPDSKCLSKLGPECGKEFAEVAKDNKAKFKSVLEEQAQTFGLNLKDILPNHPAGDEVSKPSQH